MKNKTILEKINKLNSLVTDPGQTKQSKSLSTNKPIDEGSPHSTLFDEGRSLAFSSRFSLPISQIRCDKRRQRKLTPTERNRLAKSIKEDGLWSPITVEKIGPNLYRIISGHNRYEICTQDLGWEEVPVRVVDLSTSSEKAAFISNLLQPELSIAEIYNGLCILRSDADGCRMGNKEISQETGFSPAYVSQIFSMDKLSPNVIAVLYESKVLTGANTIRALVNFMPNQNRDPKAFDQASSEFVEFVTKEYESLVSASQSTEDQSSLDVARDFWTSKIKQFLQSKRKPARTPRASHKFDPYKQGNPKLSRTNKSIVLQFNFDTEEDAKRAEKELQAKLN